MAAVAGTYASGPPVLRAYEAILSWVTTVDHKKIGIMYLVTAGIFGTVGMAFSLVIRTELAETGTIISADTYNQIFTMHGSIMIFLFLIPIAQGFMNYAVPLSIGALDMAFPRINALSFWLFALAGLLIASSFLFDGGSAAAGWTAYTPIASNSEPRIPGLQGNLDPVGVGMDLWLVGVLLLGTGSTVGGVNFIVTILKMRAPGMTMFRMPMFAWATLVTAFLVVLATPVLAAALIMMFADRNGAGGVIFDPNAGGQAILWQNLFWFYSHPAVYIMVLPSMGIVSEVISVFSRKPIFGYRSMVLALLGIGLLGFIVWAHHMFTTGGVFLPFFMAATFLIGVPTGVKMFNWIGTMYKGSIQYSSAMLFAIGFLSLFLIGGITGIFFAAVPVDFALHDTYFVVSHFHYTMSIGSTFGIFAGAYFWFPKMFGRFMNESLGKIHFWTTFIGVNIIFWPQLMLGLDGMPRRINDYAANGGWETLNMISTIGAFISAIGMLIFLFNVVHSMRWGEKTDKNDPWEANTLEWATTSPPPAHNFDEIPYVTSERPLFDKRWADKQPDAGGHGSGGATAPDPAARMKG